MGFSHAKPRFSNPRLPGLRSVDVEALADTGASALRIPPDMALELKLKTETTRTVTLANGQTRDYPYVGPIRVALENRSCFTGASVLGKSVLLGVIQMEDMNLIVNPLLRKVTVNPASPNVACGRV